MQEVLIDRGQLVRENLIELLDDVGVALHRALLRCDEAPLNSLANRIGDLRQAASAAGLAAMVSEHVLRLLRASFNGFRHFAASHTVAIADVHPALL
jgi:hypothetical protein